ncbi:9859_t:CDS:1, partial [Funneliformis geosporum]
LARTDRPPTVNEPTQRRIVNLITSQKCSSAVEVRNQLQEKENLNFLTPTICHVL